MRFDRHSQFDPIPGLSAAALNARIANDDATTALGKQQSIVDGLTRTIVLLQSKADPYGGGTWQDFIAYGQARGAYEVESPKVASLQTLQDATKLAWEAARKAFLDKANAIDQNPGAIEQM